MMRPSHSTRTGLPAAFTGQALRVAAAAATKAGGIQLAQFRSGKDRGRPLPYDIKLETDRRCEAAVIAAIHGRFPDHAILAEESGAHAGTGGFVWIVDPLDGTVNFGSGLPFFCASVACYQGGAADGGLPGAPVAGAVYLPYGRELFTAAPGEGARLNGRPIRANGAAALSEAVVSVSFGKTPASMQRMARRLEGLLPRVRKARCLGAVAAELAYIAAGYLDGLVYEGIRIWDFAAGKIILEEAGGHLEAQETEPGRWRLWACAPGLREVLGSALRLEAPE